MTPRKVLKAILVSLAFFVAAIGLTSINHPIILKWVTGAARHHGKPMPATVYVDGKMTDDIKVFYTDEANNYLISLPEQDSLGRLQLVNINLEEGTIALRAVTSKNQSDIIAGHLFEGRNEASFSSYQDGKEGYNFDPKLSYAGRQIKFNLPPDKVKFDSVRIELP